MTLAIRFWAKVIKTESCWGWAGSKVRDYGQIWHKGKHLLAHRVSWELANGPVPAGMHVLHRCDYPPCTNPAHLFLGTHNDNMRDMVKKQRTTAGTKSKAAKLTETLVAEVRRRRAAGESNSAIGRSLGIHNSVISRAVNRQRWKHVA